MSTLPEFAEPPDRALSSIVRALGEVRDRPDAWLLVFSDLVDKARTMGDASGLQIVAAASVSVPEELEAGVREAVRSLERQVRTARDASTVEVAGDGVKRVVVVVPKAVELTAVLSAFEMAGADTETFESHIRYRRTRVHTLETEEPIEVTVLCLQEAGNLPAANAVRDYQQAFGRPDLAVLCGMAMGIKRKVRLGDVVVADVVIDYAPARAAVSGPQSRFQPYQVDRQLRIDLAEHVANKTGYAERLSSSVQDLSSDHKPLKRVLDEWAPRVAQRFVLAGDELVEDDSGAERAAMNDRIAALEMEGAGFVMTCDHIGSPWLVARGIADFGDDGRHKRWQLWSTVAAAAFVRTFLETEFIPSDHDR